MKPDERTDMLKECLCCGETFDACGYGFKVFCSRKCRERNRYDSLRVHTIKTCKCCGVEFDAGNDGRMEFCSRKCSSKHYKASKRISESFVCKGCGKEFYPKGYDRTTYCSRECAYEHRWDYVVPKAKPIKNKKLICCSVCGKASERKQCSDECRLMKAAQRTHRSIGERACAWCNDMFMPLLNASDYTCCCTDHRKLYDKKTKRDAYKNNPNRRLHNGGVSRAKRSRVFARDSYICQICGKKTKKAEQLSIDHIMPVSIAKNMGWTKIQTNNENNLQTAHLMCNVMKGNRAINEQLRMNNIMIW